MRERGIATCNPVTKQVVRGALAASREADRVLGRSEQTLIPAARFDALVAALDQGDPAPR